jgi:hypothetical protein
MRTAVGLFENQALADEVVHDLEAGGLSGNDVRVLREPRDMAVTGLMSTPRSDFQEDLFRDLRAIGATEQEAGAYVQGVRRGAVLVFASGSDARVDAAAEIMNRHSPVEVEELTGGELYLPSMIGEETTSIHNSSVQAGRERSSGTGARVFVW